MGMPYAASPERSTAIRMSCSNSPSTAFASICSTKANILQEPRPWGYRNSSETPRSHLGIVLVVVAHPVLRRFGILVASLGHEVEDLVRPVEHVDSPGVGGVG